MLIQKFLMDNILVPRDVDGNVVDVNIISANLGARIMMAVDPDSYMSLNEIFAASDKEARRAQIDDILAAKDSHIQDVDPWSAYTAPLTKEELQKHFCSLKTKFALLMRFSADQEI